MRQQDWSRGCQHRLTPAQSDQLGLAGVVVTLDCLPTLLSARIHSAQPGSARPARFKGESWPRVNILLFFKNNLKGPKILGYHLQFFNRLQMMLGSVL